MMKTYTNSFLLLLTMSAFGQAQQPVPPPPDPAGTRGSQSPATAQQGEEVGSGEVLRITANLVSVPITVINRQGQYVVDLQQKDFRVYEDGKEQTIAHFSNVDHPFSVALL